MGVYIFWADGDQLGSQISARDVHYLNIPLRCGIISQKRGSSSNVKVKMGTDDVYEIEQLDRKR